MQTNVQFQFNTVCRGFPALSTTNTTGHGRQVTRRLTGMEQNEDKVQLMDRPLEDLRLSGLPITSPMGLIILLTGTHFPSYHFVSRSCNCLSVKMFIVTPPDMPNVVKIKLRTWVGWIPSLSPCRFFHFCILLFICLPLDRFWRLWPKARVFGQGSAVSSINDENNV